MKAGTAFPRLTKRVRLTILGTSAFALVTPFQGCASDSPFRRHLPIRGRAWRRSAPTSSPKPCRRGLRPSWRSSGWAWTPGKQRGAPSPALIVRKPRPCPPLKLRRDFRAMRAPSAPRPRRSASSLRGAAPAGLPQRHQRGLQRRRGVAVLDQHAALGATAGGGRKTARTKRHPYIGGGQCIVLLRVES